jgi:transposase InsO family protein
MSGFDTAIPLTRRIAVRESVNMSNKDIDRLLVLKKIEAKELTQKEGGCLLNIGERQIRRLLNRYKQAGPKAIVSKLVGRPGNRSKSIEFKQRILALLKEKYEDFGPTLAAEKLWEIDRIKISNETLRLWMIENHLWVSRRKRKKQHFPRSRRSCFGELIQADGSPDFWLGEEMGEVNATVLIDDATSIITGLYFSETENLEGYFMALEQHLNKYGRPRALYTDQYSVFCNRKKIGKTQMQIALENLDISLILANSPQAKGRVERANRTLQDRMIKEMRLRGIKTIEQANSFAEEYLEEYNRKFSKKPMNAFNAHRPLEGFDLERILCRKEVRSLDVLGIFQFNKFHYQIQGPCDNLNKKKIEIRITRSGQMRIFLGDKELQARRLDEIIEPIILDRKEVLNWKTKKWKVSVMHPWKASFRRKVTAKRMSIV